MTDKVIFPIKTSPLSPANDPWDPIRSLQKYGRHVLTSVEMTITNLCNMRCEHCAVGDSLTMTEGPKLPLKFILEKLDEVEHLETISITGGEPSYDKKTVEQYLVPLLKYAKDRGIKSQLNSNVTLDYSRYEAMLPYLDVMHISFNYLGAEDFHEVGFANAGHEVKLSAAAKLYERMIENTARLSREGMFVSAESMINYRTHDKLGQIHRLIAEMGCRRHEVHPMYPSSFAAGLPLLTLDQIRGAVDRLLDERDPELWMLFGTLPFFACNSFQEDLNLLNKLKQAPNVTVRNDPDGRNRLNVSLFTGEVFVTDFADIPSFGNVKEESFDSIFGRWLQHPAGQSVDCHCPAAGCCGPNLLVADAYYKSVDFKTRKAILA
ncbi:radical SAM/CxCxxxxC motif protein YfkAB [Paenibacillus gansuensis]|uniref:Radical SAM/CxCxxxxC motif protein YfkAB n=1 Tax=Paenibacillus gansuensis TaxID=306542 RepID=A0ABW5PGN4_9BACL